MFFFFQTVERMIFTWSFWCKEQMTSKEAEQEISSLLFCQLTAKATNSLVASWISLFIQLTKCDLNCSQRKLDFTVEAGCLWHKEMKRERFKPPEPDDPLCCCGDIDQQREYCCCDCEELDDACERSEVNQLRSWHADMVLHYIYWYKLLTLYIFTL